MPFSPQGFLTGISYSAAHFRMITLSPINRSSRCHEPRGRTIGKISPNKGTPIPDSIISGYMSSVIGNNNVGFIIAKYPFSDIFLTLEEIDWSEYFSDCWRDF